MTLLTNSLRRPLLKEVPKVKKSFSWSYYGAVIVLVAVFFLLKPQAQLGASTVRPRNEVIVKIYDESTNCTGNAVEIVVPLVKGTALCDLDDPDFNRVQSMQVSGGTVDLYHGCQAQDHVLSFDGGGYYANVAEFEGCVMLEEPARRKKIRYLRATTDSSFAVRQNNRFKKSYHAVISAESSEYYYYQVLAGLTAWYETHNIANGSYTRVLTASWPDDMGTIVPTFTAKRSAFSKRYVPFNKPDGLYKYFHSDSAPQEDVIVIMDADNWVTKDLSNIVSSVSPGHALANRAWYDGGAQERVIMALWEHLCDAPGTDACANQLKVDVALSAVPYFIHRDDIKRVLPRWRELTIKIKTLPAEVLAEFRGLQLSWCAEMFAYNFASAEAGVETKLAEYQIRDVDRAIFPHIDSPKPRDVKAMDDAYMIRMGRAWFPKDYGPGKAWQHTEGGDWRFRGNQVWCKCNYTANTVRPWPLPDTIDYVSNVTLSLLHKTQEMYGGDMPQSIFRRRGKAVTSPIDYQYAFP